MSMSDEDRQKRGRLIAIVSIAAAIAFMAVETAGAMFNWSNAVMGFLELSLCAVFAWAAINAYLLWRSRQSD